MWHRDSWGTVVSLDGTSTAQPHRASPESSDNEAQKLGQSGLVLTASSGLATSPAAVQSASSGLATSPATTAVSRHDEPEAQAAVSRQSKPEAQTVRKRFKIPLSMIESPYARGSPPAPRRPRLGYGGGLLARMKDASGLPPRPQGSPFTLGHGGGLLARLRARGGVSTPPPFIAEDPWSVVGLRDLPAAGR